MLIQIVGKSLCGIGKMLKLEIQFSQTKTKTKTQKKCVLCYLLKGETKQNHKIINWETNQTIKTKTKNETKRIKL